jgi:hypothetical protein
MNNPFVTNSSENFNPFEWSAFLRVGLPWKVWDLKRIKRRVENALKKATSQTPQFIGTRQVTEADVNNAAAALRDPNDRIIQELITHRLLPVDGTLYESERQATAELIPELPSVEPEFVLIASTLLSHLPRARPREVEAATEEPDSSIRRVGKLITTLSYAREALR